MIVVVVERERALAGEQRRDGEPLGFRGVVATDDAVSARAHERHVGTEMTRPAGRGRARRNV